jgi:hypothetical protein
MSQIILKSLGDSTKTNDVVINPSENAKFNLVFFHGDVQVNQTASLPECDPFLDLFSNQQNYKEEMLKNPQNPYSEWNLIDTTKLLCNRFSQAHCPANIFLIKANQMYLDTFAK